MSVKDLKGKSVSTSEAKEIINDVLATSNGQEFKGAVPQGQEANAKTYTLPKDVADAQAFEKQLRSEGNAREAGQFAQGFLGTIAQKLIYQTILDTPVGDLSFIERFRGENIEFGTGKEYVAMQMSGHQEFNPEQFIPTSTTKPTTITQVNNFLTESGQLNTQANAFMKQFCMSIQTYATKEFMLSDVKLQQFVNNMRDSVVNGSKLFIYNLIMEMLVNKANSAVPLEQADGTKMLKIAGTATNMFDACIEVCTHIKRMCKLGNKYQIIPESSDNEGKNHVRTCDMNNLTWIWSIDNDEKASRGIKSQLYHYKLWDPTNSIDERNVYTPGNKITLPDLTTNKEHNFPHDTGTPWIDNNTIIVLENNAIEYNLVWEKTETQYYTNNMTLQITYNLAGMINFIKVKRGFVYTNSNLSTEI